jgi:hypothetical protein
VEQTKVVPSMKEVDATKMDSIYTTTKAYTDGTAVEEIKTKHFENGKLMLDDKGKDKIETKVTKKINSGDMWFLVLMVFVQVIFVTMVYGPIAAFLVEMFPVKIRYTSMSLPYHVGNGIFGGLLPAISTYFVTTAKDAGNPEFYLEGLWYPIGIAAVCFIIGMIYIDRKINTLHD